ncbi:hypothetical protein ASG01_06360 [Chryseobacterium sp. Leaf180]|jgi:hypothetical protein|uniref:hypothetical protein n=1 Tax=Chryseobacterium sp. Leaf180 TaxID=1736289 RepID=UPI0006F74081|nr:hypothetical protein [Chryseobacterium sp. Leaf180]KQR95462.1 hypothetical protein ASG01_06360 [Chryseobacterium sp. Leaf180]
MKKFFYIFLLIAGVASLHSCKDLVDEQGDPLLDLNQNSGFNGPRALFREITDKDTLYEYRYNGLQLNQVITKGRKKGKSYTNISWSGDKISKIMFYGFLDEDRNGVIDNDSIAYTQLMTYNAGGKLETISENRSVYNLTAPVPPSTIPTLPYVLNKKYRTVYTVKYTVATGKMSGISMITGEDVTGTPFAYKNYSETTYSYLGDNVSEVIRSYGTLTGTVQSAPTEKYSYGYSVYDDKISPFTLVPVVYKISRILSILRNDYESQMFSPNSPRRITVSNLIPAIPVTTIFTSNYNYDPQTYMSKGFGVNYIYKPL